MADMNDRHRPAAPDAGETPTPADPSTSPQHHMSRRPVLLAALVGAGSLAGCSLIPGSSSAGSSPSAKPQAPEPATSSAAPSPTAAASPAPSATATATATDGALAGWSLEEKVGQLMMVGVDAQAPKQSSNEAVDTHHVGNIFIAGRTTAGSQATQKVISSFTSKVGPGTTHATPMLVATDQEGGEVQVLAGSGFSDIPSALDQSAQPRDQLVASARTWGKELADVGVNMNLAPVADLVDIARPASNEPIGRWGREYGHDAATVSSQAGAFAEGMQASKVIPTYKHFPGLGRVKDNTDTSAGVVDSTTTRSADTAVSVIFGAAIAAGAPVIMVSSATYSLIDPSAPAVFSSTIVTDMLRREMGFSGVVITDDVSAAVQVQDVSAGDRAVRAIRAGCDIVLASADPTVAADMVKALIATARSDPAFAARVDESATRVLNLKKSLQS
ncbi:glycoside hydrolase family 3 N-terminal domain-containing protein [Actinomyces sp. oral taxon 175]|uniref:glycoside hydrolase family 3 N-terminal domain-containing protein n=1 Tax=Actinomyces sp. oral taxon 175 TaxID=712119 RepID=UPI00021D31C0|nr:glycoside hydrolase family 3 N-terminal domain-containing protein [Actinomyces sp. oral taxon 175]EGV14767.1 glycosyl hydrolase family 3, N-terminal domain protein [Actinomyces sp. oral taxon 175 str. F0384]